MVIDGKAVAYHGCKTSCGATLISSQLVTTVDAGNRGGSGGRSAAASRAADVQSNDEQPHLAISCIEGVPYFIETQDGRAFSGLTGADGLLPRIYTSGPSEYAVSWGDAALVKRREGSQ
jgi:hypothetical protein